MLCSRRPGGAPLPDLGLLPIGVCSPSRSSSSPTTYFTSDIYNGELPGRVTGRAARARGRAAAVDQPDLLRAIRSPERRPIRSGSRCSRCCRPRPRSICCSSCCCSSRRTARTAWRGGSAPIGAARCSRASASPAPATSRTNCTPRDHLDRRLAAGRPGADRSRAHARAERALAVAGDVGARLREPGARRVSASGLHLRPRLRIVRAVPRAGPSTTDSVRSPRGCRRSAAIAGALALGAAAGAVVLLPMGELASVSESCGVARLPVGDLHEFLAAECLHILRALHLWRCVGRDLHRPPAVLGELRLRRRGDRDSRGLWRRARAGGGRWWRSSSS